MFNDVDACMHRPSVGFWDNRRLEILGGLDSFVINFIEEADLPFRGSLKNPTEVVSLLKWCRIE